MSGIDYSPPHAYDYKFKMITLGDSGTGKTQFSTTSIGDNARNTELVSTIGVEFFSRILEVDGKKIRVQIWDTAGQERFRAITRGYYRGMIAGLIFFDLTRRISFKNLPYWLEEVEKNRGANTEMSLIIVGTFYDQQQYREVTRDELVAFVNARNLPYMEISAKEVNRAPVEYLCREVLRRMETEELGKPEGVELGPPIEEFKTGDERCCVIM